MQKGALKIIITLILGVASTGSVQVAAAHSLTAGCTEVKSERKNGILFLDPSAITRIRIKSSEKEVALRLVGAFDTNESAYPKLERDGDALLITGIREKQGSAQLPVVQILVIQEKKEIRWLVVFSGDHAERSSQIVLSGLGSEVPSSCLEVPTDGSNRLLLSEQDLSELGVSNLRTHQIKIPDPESVYRKLGL